MLKFLTYYAQYYAHAKELCLKSDCSIRVYSLVSKIFINMLCVLLEYIDLKLLTKIFQLCLWWHNRPIPNYILTLVT